MIKRFFHFLFGHNYEMWSVSRMGGTGQAWYTSTPSEEEMMRTHGFCELRRFCGCGKSIMVRIMGNVRIVSDPKSIEVDSEIKELRKMAGLQ